MKTILRVLSLLMVAGMIFCLCACGENPGNTTGSSDVAQSSEPSVPTTEDVKPTDAPEEKKPTYTVTVVDESNAPLAGVWVQLCLEACVPTVTNEQGVAEFFLEENDYKVSIMMMPEGYTYATEEMEWHFADGENTMTITLKAAE